MNKLPHNYYDLAPTIMPVEDVYKYLDELLTLIESRKYDEMEVYIALDELIVTRLSDNYASLNSEFSDRVFKWLAAHWPTFNEEHLDLYLTVMVNLYDTKAVKEYLQDRLLREGSMNRKELINDALSEIVT